jgi:hypothetical protein
LLAADGNSSSALFAEKRRLGLAAMQRSREHSLAGFSDVYRAASQQACASIDEPDSLSQGFQRFWLEGGEL